MTWDRNRNGGREYDIFISHASEDKEIVRPLANQLSNKDLDVWYDEFELDIGDSVSESLDEGLTNSEYGIVVLSEAFFDTNWSQYELNSLISRNMSEESVILPLWYNIDKEIITEYSPALSDIYALNINKNNVDDVAEQIFEYISEDSDITEMPDESSAVYNISSQEVETLMEYEATRIPPNDIEDLNHYFERYESTILDIIEQHKPLFSEEELAYIVDIIGTSVPHLIGKTDEYRKLAYELSIEEKEAGRYLALKGLREWV